MAELIRKQCPSCVGLGVKSSNGCEYDAQGRVSYVTRSDTCWSCAGSGYTTTWSTGSGSSARRSKSAGRSGTRRPKKVRPPKPVFFQETNPAQRAKNRKKYAARLRRLAACVAGFAACCAAHFGADAPLLPSLFLAAIALAAAYVCLATVLRPLVSVTAVVLFGCQRLRGVA